MADPRVADLTVEQLRNIIREEIQRINRETSQAREQLDFLDSDLSDFPVDSYGSWPADLSLRREDMYGDDQR